MGPEVAPAACFEGGGHQVQGPQLLEMGKLEHPPETAELPCSDGIRRSQGDGEGAERGRMTSGALAVGKSTAGFRTGSVPASVGCSADRGDGAGRRRLWPLALLGSGSAGVSPPLAGGEGFQVPYAAAGVCPRLCGSYRWELEATSLNYGLASSYADASSK